MLRKVSSKLYIGARALCILARVYKSVKVNDPKFFLYVAPGQFSYIRLYNVLDEEGKTAAKINTRHYFILTTREDAKSTERNI